MDSSNIFLTYFIPIVSACIAYRSYKLSKKKIEQNEQIYILKKKQIEQYIYKKKINTRKNFPQTPTKSSLIQI